MSEQKNTSNLNFGQWLLKGIRHVFLHNGWIKLFSVLASVVLWAGLISQDESLTREKTFNNVLVNITGVETLKYNGMIAVTDIKDQLKEVSIVAAVPQKYYDSAEASAYNVRADLSRITQLGVQELKLQSTASNTYGKVISMTPNSVDLDVEEYISRNRIPVNVTLEGEKPDGWYISPITPDPSMLTVSGPATLVNSIYRARVFPDYDDFEWEEGTCRVPAKLKLYNRDGEEVDMQYLEVSYENTKKLDSVLLEATILPVRTFDVMNLFVTENQPAKGYEVKSMHITPESITLAARREILDTMMELPIEYHTINLKGLKETTTFQIKVSKPSEDAVLLPNDKITVTVEIVPTESN